jgi:hypothetical protein
MRSNLLTERHGRRARRRAELTRRLLRPVVPAARAVRGQLRRGWRALPTPARDAAQKVMLRTGHGEVVPVDDYEAFLAAHLPSVRAPGGAYVEFGVYLGSSMAAAVRAFDRCGCEGARFVGFDSFAGLPVGSEAEGWPSGAFAASRDVAEWHLRRHGVLDRVELVEGWFEDTCNDETAAQLALGPVVVAMIDCDVYSASATALAFVEPFLAGRSLLIFDDWFAHNPAGDLDEGQRRAMREFLADHPRHACTELGRVGFFGLAFLLTKDGATP